ncbi:3-methyladenine DNA glycosylase [Helicobacter ailurogastricus]|uniref:Endonuclease III n=1 Tax=Helicobacter ailurogastricus TaxID=1578720 RepID=A0A0K2X7H4_9HELI|nr:3-methyladenine DNA glycosylase [Helicobacter ailurogastricus]CRF40751.1 Endonuclease III [Helicobacter ailurogastricus]CRF42457.1 Endonuclease III [Helicobacter ailurogastricus]CRF43651.1 Endonuclease III [Helicobacter ailurogastricus]GLH57615.1 3-methyladenine DNA glycosylase MagIII [Helicobacter ailurogastricus]GLH59977.1 3-methyladenine DNA glycosylase MagIII [Helicobacter ailurogastricus]
MSLAFCILKALKSLNLLDNAPPLWWPNAGSVEVVLGAILTQRTKFSKAQESLERLKNAGILEQDPNKSLHNLAHTLPATLAQLISPSGFYNQKARSLIALSQNLLKDFDNFESFKKGVSRAWLLAQKGVGFESADGILNYACLRPVFVVDAYTYKLLATLGLEMEDYHALQEFFTKGLEQDLPQTLELYANQLDLAGIYARLHGKIVACMQAKIALKPHLKDCNDLY